VNCKELRQLAFDASSQDDKRFLLEHPGPSLLLVDPGSRCLERAIVVPIGCPTSLATLGRHHENDIVAPWPSISRRHAVIVIGPRMTVLLDRGSANGTFVQGERLVPDAPRFLGGGEEISFGSDVRALFLTPCALLQAARRLGPAT
jgi:hypothetical protein